jgi:hypothetical protein
MKNYELTPNALKLLKTVKRSNLFIFNILIDSTSTSIFDESNKSRTPIIDRNKNNQPTDLRSVISNISIKTTKK